MYSKGVCFKSKCFFIILGIRILRFFADGMLGKLTRWLRIMGFDVVYGIENDDKTIINSFIAYLRNNGQINLRIDRWPDNKNSESSDIDAVAGQFAIEHTGIDTIEHQRRNSDWFMKIAGVLEEELKNKLKYHLIIIFPYFKQLSLRI